MIKETSLDVQEVIMTESGYLSKAGGRGNGMK